MEATVHCWSDLPADQPLPLLERRRVIAERVMISRIVLRAGCVVPTHAHENEQVACVLSGRMRFAIGPEDAPDRRIETLEGGSAIVLPSGVPHGAEALEDSVVLDVFSPPSATTGIDRPGG